MIPYSVIFLLITLLITINGEIQAELHFNLVGSGFHRDLEYNIYLHGVPDGEFCEFSLVQELGSSVYVNLDQLSDLKKFNKVYSYVPSYVDVELPKNRATPNDVYLFGVARENNLISVPLHYRYHAVGYRKFVKIIIDVPRLLLRCPTDLYPHAMNITSPCSTAADIRDFEELQFAEQCQWDEIEFVNSVSAITSTIPIGNKQMMNVVFSGTLLTSWLGCIYIAFSILKSKDLNKKIE